jgi:ubiquinone/menaquinone biosynthesis C-methylase UbiE
VGDGDGYVSMRIQERTGAIIQGLDILHFKKYRVQRIPLVIYDGNEIPFTDRSFDISAGVFLLHHCQNYEFTLQEMIRVSKRKLILFEDVFNNRLELTFLRFFDTIENRTFSSEMPIPYHFKTILQWKNIFKKLNLKLVYSVQFRALPLPVRNQAFCLVKN